MTEPGPDLSIIIVSWNVRDFLRACLESLAGLCDELMTEVIVVDGGSVDGSAEMVREEFPWVLLIALSENVGFPKGNNIGLREARGRYLLLLNPDTEVREGALEEMVDFLAANSDVGVVGPQLQNPDGTIQSSRRRFPTLATGLLESTWLEAFAPKAVLRHYYAEDLPDDAARDVDWLTGACLMVRQEILVEVGLLDEAYFMYSEELDWCRRIRMAGWRVVYLPQAKVLHHIGKSSEQAVTDRHLNFQRAKLRYFRKYHGRAAAGILRITLLANYVGQMFLEAGKAALGHRRTLRKQRLRAYWQIVRSGLRPAGY